MLEDQAASRLFDYATTPHLPLPIDRDPEQQREVKLPSGLIVVSPDSHLSVREDIWFQGFPDRLRDKAPRVWQENGAFHIGFGGQSLFNPAFEAVFCSYDPMPGTSLVAPRMADLSAEGIDKELVFGNNAMALLNHPDLEMREWIYRIYNEYLAKLAGEAPDRFYGVALMNYWDTSRVRQEIQEIKALGHKTIMLPIKPGKLPDGTDISYAGEEMEPLWAAIEEAGIPICFHVGESYFGGRGGVATSFLVNTDPFRPIVGQLIFGGVLDRHPNLKIVFVEAGLKWVPGVLQDIEMIYRNFWSMLDWKPKKSAQEYWRTNFYATFIQDELGLTQLDILGADRVMWASDYPHAESTYGYGWSAMAEVMNAVGEDDARKILGDTALNLFDLH